VEKDKVISTIEPVGQKAWPNQMVVNNTSPNIYGSFLLMIENTSCPRIFKIPDLAIMAVDYSFPCKRNFVSKQSTHLEVRHVYNSAELFHQLMELVPYEI
jgi:hypothetical protein